MSESIYPVPEEWARRARVDAAGYDRLHGRSLADRAASGSRPPGGSTGSSVPNSPATGRSTRRISTSRGSPTASSTSCVNCVDRHLASRGRDTAILWEPDEPGEEPRRFTYLQLYEEVCRFANVLRAEGVRKGDRVTIYLPMIPEAAFALLACARIGAIHSVVFGGFSPEALAGRITDCDSAFCITRRRGPPRRASACR